MLAPELHVWRYIESRGLSLNNPRHRDWGPASWNPIGFDGRIPDSPNNPLTVITMSARSASWQENPYVLFVVVVIIA